jgi:hypothetical protein
MTALAGSSISIAGAGQLPVSGLPLPLAFFQLPALAWVIRLVASEPWFELLVGCAVVGPVAYLFARQERRLDDAIAASASAKSHLQQWRQSA